MHKWFITGTDTDVGKTYVGQIMMQGLALKGLKTVGFKPISAGCQNIDGVLVNDDAMQYVNNSNLPVSLPQVNPIAYEPPIAPHIAAKQVGETLTLSRLEAGLAQLTKLTPDIVVTEGAGGWRLPLGQGEFLSSFPVQQQMKVVMVVGLRLGCLNHALLTAEAIKNDGAQLCGWIGNHIDPNMLNQQDNIDSLCELLGKPLGMIPYGEPITDSEKIAIVSPLIE